MLNLDNYTIAVDFDGTLCKDAFPEIGEPKQAIIEYVRREEENGAKIILHTCRENGTRRLLDEAIQWCYDNDIPIHAVNQNPFSKFGEKYGTVGKERKVFADLYIDDKALNTADIELSSETRRSRV